MEIKDLKKQKKVSVEQCEAVTNQFKEMATRIAKRYREHKVETTAVAKKMKLHHDSETESLITRIQEAQAALANCTANEQYAKRALQTPVGLAEALELSPGTQKTVSLNCYSGVLHGNPNKSFIGRIKRSLTPLVKAICAFPKFEDGKTDIAGVAKVILDRIMKSKKTKRTLFNADKKLPKPEDAKPEDAYTTPKRSVSPDISDQLDAFLQEMGIRWRARMCEHDRHAAREIEEIALKAIGTNKRQGRVTDWLGPKYFDSIVPISLYSEVRILNPQDKKTKFRNACVKSSLVTGSVTLMGEEHVEVMVLEDFGPQVVIKDDVGEERVLNLDELERCKLNPYSMNHPATSVLHHRWNRKQFLDDSGDQKGRLCVGVQVKHKGPDKKWKTAIVLRVVRGYNQRHVAYTIAKDRVIHANSVRLSRFMIQRARKTNKLWGAAGRRRRAHGSVRERHVISPATFDHLRDYIFSTDFVEPLKASEQAIRRGHCFAVREAIRSAYPRYRADATKKAIDPVACKVFRRIFSSKVFTKYRKDHCMCKTCLRSGWRGIWERGRELLKALNSHKCWPRTKTVDGRQEVHRPELESRLKRVWDCLRLRLSKHFKYEDGIGSHCLCHLLSSAVDTRLDEQCRHEHPNQQSAAPLDPPEENTQEQPATKCSEPDCKKRASLKCKYCEACYCRGHLESKLCTSECLPPANLLDEFICRGCRATYDEQKHSSAGCATCEEIQFFKKDLMRCAERTKNENLVGRARAVCECIDTMVGHTARIVNQERFWPHTLDKMRKDKEYDHVLLKSDYWKKFEGTVMKQGLCTSNPKQSVETHSAWYLIPPKDAIGVNWELFPKGIEYYPADKNGFRGFIVEFINVISDVVVQDGYQSVLNLRTVLRLISSRHPRIRWCTRETDGAGSYNSFFVALMTLQLGNGGASGNIKVIQHGHNEPGHGADICDTAGANCIRECWRKTKRTGLAIICASRTTATLREAAMPGFLHLQVSHCVARDILVPALHC